MRSAERRELRAKVLLEAQSELMAEASRQCQRADQFVLMATREVESARFASYFFARALALRLSQEGISTMRFDTNDAKLMSMGIIESNGMATVKVLPQEYQELMLGVLDQESPLVSNALPKQATPLPPSVSYPLSDP
jgi:hypothetical protein